METIIWNKFTTIEEIPIDEVILLELDTTHRKFQTGYFRKNDSGNVLGIVGNVFHFDVKIIQWASINHLLPK
jgi:hypothetical protein